MTAAPMTRHLPYHCWGDAPVLAVLGAALGWAWKGTRDGND